jgi:hypothetical protein
MYLTTLVCIGTDAATRPCMIRRVAYTGDTKRGEDAGPPLRCAGWRCLLQYLPRFQQFVLGLATCWVRPWISRSWPGSLMSRAEATPPPPPRLKETCETPRQKCAYP